MQARKAITLCVTDDMLDMIDEKGKTEKVWFMHSLQNV